ncbi:tetratricopeptide repeat protein [Mariniflexile sp.]|uniref:tetratricopeptide repeat protein n=1 Tax=Mariniflexile sp. TaxID=1979402 RepID=UPI0035659F8C
MINQVERLNKEGVKLFLNGKFEDAKNKYMEALEINPSFPATLNNIGMCFLQEQDFIKAETYFNNAINEKESDSYLLNLGHALANQGCFEKAEKKYKKSIAINPTSLMAYKSLGSLYQKQKRFSESIKVWETVINNYSRDPLFIIELAKDLIQLSEYYSALAALYEAEKFEKNRDLTWYYMSLIHFHLKNFGLAEKAIKRSVGIKPDNQSFRAMLAAIYLGVSDIKNAIKQWDFILTLDKNNTPIRLDKAVALLAFGYKKEALEIFEFILNQDSSNEKANYYKALTLLEINKSDKNAINTLKNISSNESLFSKQASDILMKLNC